MPSHNGRWLAGDGARDKVYDHVGAAQISGGTSIDRPPGSLIDEMRAAGLPL